MSLPKTCVRLPQATITALRRAAHLESLRRGEEISVGAIIRDAIHAHPLVRKSQVPAEAGR